ncbi:MAG: hypothetical protein ABIQ47_13555 [Tepidiformaceae bacterium]
MKHTLQLPQKEHWNNAATWFLWTFLSVAIPLGGSALLFAVLDENGRSLDLVNQGQLGLYAAAMIAMPAYVCSIDRDVTRLRWRGVMLFVSVVVLVASTLIYAGVQTANVVSARTNQQFRFNESLTLFLSAAALFVALTVSFFATVADGERQQLSFSQVIDRQRDDLTEQFRELDNE